MATLYAVHPSALMELFFPSWLRFYIKHCVTSKPCYCLFSHNVPLCMTSKSMLEYKRNHMWSTPSAHSYILHTYCTLDLSCVCLEDTLHYIAPARKNGLNSCSRFKKHKIIHFPSPAGLSSLSTVKAHTPIHVHRHTNTHTPSLDSKSYPCLHVNSLLIACYLIL